MTPTQRGRRRGSSWKDEPTNLVTQMQLLAPNTVPRPLMAKLTVDIQSPRSTGVPGQTLEVKTANIDPHASASSAPEADADASQVAWVASAPTPLTGVGPPCSLRITARKRSTAWTVAWARTDGNMSNACCAPGSSA